MRGQQGKLIRQVSPRRRLVFARWHAAAKERPFRSVELLSPPLPPRSIVLSTTTLSEVTALTFTCMVGSAFLALLRRNRATNARSRGRPVPFTFDTANTGVMRSEAMLSAAASTCSYSSIIAAAAAAYQARTWS